MRLVAVIVAALASGLAVTGVAMSKTVWPPGTICGQSRCIGVHGLASAALQSWDTSDPWAQLSAPSRAPYYVIRLRDSSFRSYGMIVEQIVYVPSRRMVRIYYNRTLYSAKPLGPYWRSVSQAASATMDRVVSRIAPHRPAPRWPRP